MTAKVEASSVSSFWTDDPSLARLLEHYLSKEVYAWGLPLLEKAGALAAGELDELAFLADKHSPVLETHDRNGERIDEVRFHPSYRRMEELVYGELGVVGMIYGVPPRGAEPVPGGRAPRVLSMGVGHVASQSDAGLFCPVCMTDGVARVLEKYAGDDVQDAFIPRLAATDRTKLFTGAMFLTEKQGGSDVGANTCEARQEDGVWRLYGDKWFCSNVNAEAILALARPTDAADGTRGLGLFLVRSTRDDGTRNGFRIHRIKDKLGVRAMATGEVTFDGAEAILIGGPGEGFKQMASMVNLSRMYNANASVSAGRRAWREAASYASERVAFGRPIEKFPLLRATVGTLAARVEAARQLVFAATHTMDLVDAGDTDSARLLRLLTPIAKFTTAKLAVSAASEAMEVLGGNGYIEEFVTARLLRDAQVLPIWEGTTNIQVLDVLRALEREQAGDVFFEMLGKSLGEIQDERLQALAQLLHGQLDELAKQSPLNTDDPALRQLQSRPWAERAGATYSAALLLQAADRSMAAGDARDAAVARTFIAASFGTEANVLAARYYDAIAKQDSLDPKDAFA